jgi:CBS domain-containing protein
MKVKDIMSSNPACCTLDTSISEVAQMMVEYDCGALPVVDNPESMRPLLGVLTDRDIVCRLIAVGKNPMDSVAKDCMSKTVVTVSPDDTLERCQEIMEENQVRRVPVVDKSGACLGLVTQAQMARHMSDEQAGHLLKGLSEQNESPSRVAVTH